MKQSLVLGTLFFLLSGCGTVPDLPSGYTLSAQDAEGLAVVSLTLSGKNLEQVSSFEYQVRQVPAYAFEEAERSRYFGSARQHVDWLRDGDAKGKAPQRIKLIVKGEASAELLDVVESNRAIGRLAALRLPPGNYEIYDWKVEVPDQYGGDKITPKRTVGYRFKIEAGRATYLGNVDLRLTDQGTYNVTVDNKTTRDLALLAKKLPSIRAEDIIYRPSEMRP